MSSLNSCVRRSALFFLLILLLPVAKADGEILIRFCPGSIYFPGRSPLGAGEPLDGFEEVARSFEAENPGVKIRFEMVPGSREYFLTQVANGNSPEILQVNAEEVLPDTGKGWYLPLDDWLNRPNPFAADANETWLDSFAYPAVYAKRRGQDGKIYTVCYDINETAIYYNKTKLKELGLDEPKTWAEFSDRMEAIRRAGYLPINTGLWFHVDWNLDLFFDQLYHPLYPEMFPRLGNDGSPTNITGREMLDLFDRGYFRATDPRFREMWRLVREFRDYAPRDILHSDPFRDFLGGKSLMFWNSSFLLYRLQTMKPDFEVGLFYPPPITRETSPFATGLPFASLGGAGTQFAVAKSAWNDTGDPATSPKLAAVVAFLQWITSEPRYSRVVAERPMMIPILRGVPVPETLRGFQPILQRRSVPIRWYSLFDLRFRDNLRRNAELYLNGHMSLDDFLETQEGNFRQARKSLENR
jgi:raffinose/stachyose/melibiose transport system substrate-binding protein